MQNAKVLILDDEKNITTVIQAILGKVGITSDTFQDPHAALHAIHQEEYGTLITDLFMPSMDGMEVLSQMQRDHKHIPVVMITAFGTIGSAVNALKLGAFDYITKPFEQVDLVSIVSKALETYRLRMIEPITFDSKEIHPNESVKDNVFSVIKTKSPKMNEIFNVTQKISKTDSYVMIEGESGTGKRLVAQCIHQLSERSKQPFIQMHCGAIPSDLIDKELFGFESEVQNNSMHSKTGRLELSHGGTLFLDEVTELPLETQSKLLRYIEDNEIVREGGINEIKVDVRLITASSQNLEKAVSEGLVREDLYYRLNALSLRIPPLRERREDIPLLVEHFIHQYNQKLNRQITHIEPACLNALKVQSWPGNIRQLENTIERMVLLADQNSLRMVDLPIELTETFEVEDLGHEDLSHFKEIVKKRTQLLEKELIQRALDETEGNITKAAEVLGLSRKGLQLKLKELSVLREKPTK